MFELSKVSKAARILSVLATAAAFVAIASPAARAARQERPSAQTSDGPVVGLYRRDVAEFLGVPYAAPPTGSLRWRPPQPPAKWTNPLLSVYYRNSCVQNQAGQFAHPSITEDCLYLNVFTPRDFAQKKEARPVLVWFYGGGVVAGETNDYDGRKLARQGDAIVVTVNFRVGSLGFFAEPALDHEGHDFANYGFMDQQLALKWIQNNIANFGGDPHNVTIFGQSGGATTVMAELVSPRAKGLFQKIINESGTHILATPLADAEKMGADFAKRAGCAVDDAACLRKLSPAKIVELGSPPVSYYIVDGDIITQPTYESFKSGQFNHVPIMTGLTADEQAFFLPELQGGPTTPLTAAGYKAFVDSFGKEHEQDILAAYPLSAYASPSLADIAAAEGNKACTARNFDQIWSKYVNVYAYVFDDETTPSYLRQASYPTRAYHTSELLYLFPLFHGGQGTPHLLSDPQEHLSDQLVAWWTNFARTGDPNGGADAKQQWRKYASADDNVFMITETNPHMTSNYGSQTYPYNMKNDCALWDKVNTYE